MSQKAIIMFFIVGACACVRMLVCVHTCMYVCVCEGGIRMPPHAVCWLVSRCAWMIQSACLNGCRFPLCIWLFACFKWGWHGLALLCLLQGKCRAWLRNLAETKSSPSYQLLWSCSSLSARWQATLQTSFHGLIFKVKNNKCEQGCVPPVYYIIYICRVH